MTCCEINIFYGCVSSCDDFTMPVEASYTGLMTLEFSQFDNGYRLPFEVTEGEAIVIPNVFNENSSPIFKLKNFDGTYVEVDEVDCFRINVQLTFTIGEQASDPTPPPAPTFNQLRVTVDEPIGTIQLPWTPYDVNRILVQVNGVAQTIGVNYTITAGGLVTFTYLLENGDEIWIREF